MARAYTTRERLPPRSVRRRSFDAGRLARCRERWDFGPSVDIWPARLWDGNPRPKAGTQEIRVSYAVDGHCRAPEQDHLPQRGHRPHPLDVQRQAHEVPLAAHLARTRWLRCAYRLCPRGAPVSHPCVAGSRSCRRRPRFQAVRAMPLAIFQCPNVDPARCFSARIGAVRPARRLVDRSSSSPPAALVAGCLWP